MLDTGMESEDLMQHKMSGSICFDAGRWPLNADKPTLVFIHGAANNRLFWRHQVEGLADQFNSVAIDLPGHGKSPGTGCGSIAGYTQVVLSFLDQLQIQDPIPCGLSMGGAITLQLLMDHGDRFSAGILMNTGARLRVNPLLFHTIETNFDKFVESIVSMALSSQSDKDALRPVIQEIVDCEPMVAYNDFKACDQFDVMQGLKAIETPVLVVTASDDKLTPPKYGQFMAQEINNARLENIAAAGHMPPLEKPEAVNAAIRQFLNLNSLL
jgi:pimeloyl-ACP methyl ester carboxylesterase